ncbi:hypothetical protein [Corynebacterium silvaticum]|uniref:hypothetical protein n=1 Tax=Corynebacterium silvaticum TaxID=2320431 RepID=UPI001CED5160|nr:hypothetical protein [Corynebacterium silvaticum]
MLPCTDHSLPDSEESTVGYPVGYLEIDVPLQSNLSSIACDIILDAELQPLPAEQPSDEAREGVRFLLESLPSLAEKLGRPIIQLWKLMPAEPTPYRAVSSSQSSMNKALSKVWMRFKDMYPLRIIPQRFLKIVNPSPTTIMRRHMISSTASCRYSIKQPTTYR